MLKNITSRDFKFKNDRHKYPSVKKRSNSLDFEEDGITRKNTKKILRGITSKSMDLDDSDSMGSSKNLSDEEVEVS